MSIAVFIFIIAVTYFLYSIIHGILKPEITASNVHAIQVVVSGVLSIIMTIYIFIL